MSVSNTPAPDGTFAAQTPAAALAEPVERVTARWVTGLVLVNVGINAAFFGPINVFIGQQAISIDAPAKEAILSLVTACGAAVSLVANPSSVRCRTGPRHGSAGGRRGCWPGQCLPPRRCWPCPSRVPWRSWFSSGAWCSWAQTPPTPPSPPPSRTGYPWSNAGEWADSRQWARPSESSRGRSSAPWSPGTSWWATGSARVRCCSPCCRTCSTVTTPNFPGRNCRLSAPSVSSRASGSAPVAIRTSRGPG
ncbi:hypothetical protein ARTHRO8AJ_10229 [Arthrobacter sp. 8AJ]|nr:hypothetical protein ARTHRO8AJ_10229 [Arthrobacter sp. 8AJ]